MRISITPLSKAQIGPIRLNRKTKKTYRLLIWRFGLFFILINYGNPFLSDTNFYCD